jgi:hypothetical protein
MPVAVRSEQVREPLPRVLISAISISSPRVKRPQRIPPGFLEGRELVLIVADADVFGELGIRLEPERETMETTEIFNMTNPTGRPDQESS